MPVNTALGAETTTPVPCASCGLVSDPDLFAKFGGLCEVWLSTLTFLVEQADTLNPPQLAACELLQTTAFTLKALVASEVASKTAS
jgi:hypothetical protein